VIDTLLERGYRITSIAGSSIGSLIGGLYATGSLDRYRDWVVGLDKLDVLRLLDFTLSAKGFVKGERVFNRMRKLQLIPDVNIEELPIPYAVSQPI
jgi:NTE family protein